MQHLFAKGHGFFSGRTAPGSWSSHFFFFSPLAWLIQINGAPFSASYLISQRGSIEPDPKISLFQYHISGGGDHTAETIPSISTYRAHADAQHQVKLAADGNLFDKWSESHSRWVKYSRASAASLRLQAFVCAVRFAGWLIKEQTCEFPSALYCHSFFSFSESSHISTASPLLALLLCT